MQDRFDPRKLGHRIGPLADDALQAYRSQWLMGEQEPVEMVYLFGLPREPRLEPVQEKLIALGCTVSFTHEDTWSYWMGQARCPVQTIEEARAVNDAVVDLLREANALYSRRVIESKTETEWLRQMSEDR